MVRRAPAPQRSDGPVDHRDEPEPVTQQPGSHAGDGIEQGPDVADDARLRVYAGRLDRRAASLPQTLDRAPQEQRLESPHVIHVLVAHEDVPDVVGCESACQYLADDIHPVPGVEENPSAVGVISPREQQARLMPLGIRGTARAQKPKRQSHADVLPGDADSGAPSAERFGGFTMVR